MVNSEMKLIELFERYADYPVCWMIDIPVLFERAILFDKIAISGTADLPKKGNNNLIETAVVRHLFLQPRRVKQDCLVQEMKNAMEERRQRRVKACRKIFGIGGPGRGTSPINRQIDFVVEGMIQRYQTEFGELPAVYPTYGRPSDQDEEVNLDGKPRPQPFVRFLSELFVVMEFYKVEISTLQSRVEDIRSAYPLGTREQEVNDHNSQLI